MKIQQLFDELKLITDNKDEIFKESGLVNCYNKMKYGFFPLGLGVLTDEINMNSKASDIEIAGGGVMVLGNDFGTLEYVKSVNEYSSGFGETRSTTIRNLTKKIALDRSKAFFTNIYLGVRTNKNAKMTYRIEELTTDYKDLCYDFFIEQLKLVQPRLVICLGHDVKDALIDSIESKSFNNWTPKSITMKKLYEGGENSYEIDIESNNLGKRKFVVIPHPCYIGNLKKEYMEKLNKVLEDNGLSK